MKKTYKRISTLIMVLVMAFSLSVVTYAAGVDAYVPEAEDTISTYDLPGPADGGPVVIHTNGYITCTVAHTYEFNISSFEDNRYLYLHILTEGPVRMTMYQNGVQVSSVVYANKAMDGEAQWLPIYHNRTTNNCWARGDYTVKVEILFNYKCTFGICSTTRPIH